MSSTQMAPLKLSVPIEGLDGLKRKNYLLHIGSVDEWNTTLVARSQIKLSSYESRSAKPATALTGDNSKSRFHRLGPSERDFDSKGGALLRKILVEIEKHKVQSEEAKDVSDKSLLGRTSSPESNIGSSQSQPEANVNSERERILKCQQETLEILEGKRVAVPDRNYSGHYRFFFQLMAEGESVITREQESRRCILNGSSTSLADRPLRGWGFIRDIIVSRLYEHDSVPFPPYIASHRVYLLELEEIRGKARVRAIRNLDSCSMVELLKLMLRIGERGWRDVLWIMNSSDKLPRSFDPEGDAEDLLWGFE
ncbi:hypothetical protein BGZ63DRAFT_403421 [Mariannaea sp. PMI_226]|nr:hypothetical protein BGZ63DRAFT_403421 [Mariannaea sp. PMI_226]